MMDDTAVEVALARAREIVAASGRELTPRQLSELKSLELVYEQADRVHRDRPVSIIEFDCS